MNQQNRRKNGAGGPDIGPRWIAMAGLAAVMGLAAAFAGGCQEKKPTPAAGGLPGARVYPYTVAATVGMVADIVANVAGDKAKVTGIIGSSVDPHLFKPTSSDIKQLMAADAVFYSGLLLEGKMSDVLVKVAGSRPVFAVTELLDEQYHLKDPSAPDHPDPHVWMDVAAWMKAVEVVRESLGSDRLDPANREYYRRNAEAYLKEMAELDAYAKKSFATIPEKSRVLITAHDAFNYMGRAYKLKVEGIQGLSTESEAGLTRINQLVDLIVANDIQAVFVESSVSDKNVKALVEGAKSRGRQVRIGGELFSDAMGKPGTYEGTYLGMIDHNITTITRALGGQAPQAGMKGKLSHVK